MELKDSDILTFDNICELGFTYNYFEGYSYTHEDGYWISVYNPNVIIYQGKGYDCITVRDFKQLKKTLLK